MPTAVAESNRTKHAGDERARKKSKNSAALIAAAVGETRPKERAMSKLEKLNIDLQNACGVKQSERLTNKQQRELRKAPLTLSLCVLSCVAKILTVLLSSSRTSPWGKKGAKPAKARRARHRNEEARGGVSKGLVDSAWR